MATYQHQQAPGLRPGAAASEEAHHKPSAANAHEDGVRTQAGMLRQEGGIALVAQSQPKTGAQERTATQLERERNTKITQNWNWELERQERNAGERALETRTVTKTNCQLGMSV